MILSLKNCTRNFKRSFILKKDIELSSLNKIFYLKIDYIPLWLFCDYLSFAQVVSKMYSEPQRSDSKLYSEPQKKSSNRFCGAQILFANYLCSTIFLGLWLYLSPSLQGLIFKQYHPWFRIKTLPVIFIIFLLFLQQFISILGGQIVHIS